MEAVEQGCPLMELASVLEALVAAEQLDAAETLGWMLLGERAGQLPPEQALDVAKAVVSAVPVSDELRGQAAEIYRKIHGGKDHFDAVLRASGLTTGQSPRRAFRTLDICLAAAPGSYLVNRFDHNAFRLAEFDATLGEYQFSDAAGKPHHLEPKAMADEFDPVDESDFRVMCQFCPAELTRLLEDEPAAVLIGLCLSSGGEINSAHLKDKLCPKHLPAEKWSGWWNRARTAANRCKQLSLEGRNPIVVKYHPAGLTLEDELAGAASSARAPLDKLLVAQQYLRQAAQRKLLPNPAFLATIMNSLSEQAAGEGQDRSIALAAALAIEKLTEAGAPAPAKTHPSSHEILAACEVPAAVIAAMDSEELFPAALDRMAVREDALAQLQQLMCKSHAAVLDKVAARLLVAEAGQSVAKTIADAMARPLENLQVCLWLWKGPTTPLECVPPKMEILTRLLNVLIELDRDWDVDPAFRKEVCQQVRSALGAGDYASYRAALAEMSEAVAGTTKRRIERCDGLAEAVQGKMMGLLRESFYSLFVEAKVAPWLVEGVIWTTEAGLSRQQEEFHELTDVKMLANARDIGAAAAHGDLRENADWQFAMEEKRRFQAQAAKMQDDLARARVLRTENVPTDSVGIGSRVTLRPAEGGVEVTMTFLGPWDGDLSRNIYTYKTPLAQSMMGKAVGETVVLKGDAQETQYRIERIESAI